MEAKNATLVTNQNYKCYIIKEIIKNNYIVSN